MNFCTICGELFKGDGRCVNGHVKSRSKGRLVRAKAVQLPKAKVSLRLLGSGVEYFAYVLALTLLNVVSVFTFGTADGFFAPLLVLMILIRDVNSGRFSVAKRLGKMRVVEIRSGAPASNKQALLRNASYWAVCGLMIFPVLPLDVLVSMAFMLLLVLDTCLIIFSAEGRRVGDLMAGTQVINEGVKEL